MQHAEHGGLDGVTFDSGGHRLVGVIYLARGRRPRPTALLLHGCPGLEKNLDLAADLRDRGWNALVFHYRGCWGSSGGYDLRTIPADVSAAVDFLQSGEYLSVDPDRIAVIGHSLGGWAAVLAAASDQRLRAVAVCGGVADLGTTQLSFDVVEREISRFIATDPAGFRQQRDDVAAAAQPLDVIGSIAPRPVLIVHGAADEWVPVRQARMLYERAVDPRRYVEFDVANHSFSWHRGELRELLAGWLAETTI